jgi:hypothetical protein
MARKKKQTEITVTQDVVRTGVQGQSFDLMLHFTDNALQPQLYMDELVKLVLEGLLAKYGSIIVKVNWWAEGFTVIAPNASVTSQEGSGATEIVNPT